MNDCEGHQRSFSARTSERPLHLQDRALAIQCPNLTSRAANAFEILVACIDTRN